MECFVAGAGCGRTTLRFNRLDDWSLKDDRVSVIDAFVDALDLGELQSNGVRLEATGRPWATVGPVRAAVRGPEPPRKKVGP